MRIILSYDHGGYELAQKVKQKFDVVDVGLQGSSTDFPNAVENIMKEKWDRAILICGSGMGVSIAANRHKGVRAALLWNKEMAKLAREHNDANVLCLGGRFLGESEAFDIIETFLNTEFLGGKYQHRIDMIERHCE